jgi:hypothetical protein
MHFIARIWCGTIMRTFEITNKNYFNSNKQTDKHELSEFLYFIQLTINDLDQAAERIIH